MLNKHDPEIPIRAMVVLLDETEYWGKSVIDKCGKVWAAYLYDENCYHYLCSTQPCYWLRYLCSSPEKLIEDDKEREDMYDRLETGSDDGYFDAKVIKAIPAARRMLVKEVKVETDEDYNVAMEDIWEWLRGNHVFTLPNEEEHHDE